MSALGVELADDYTCMTLCVRVDVTVGSVRRIELRVFYSLCIASFHVVSFAVNLLTCFLDCVLDCKLACFVVSHCVCMYTCLFVLCHCFTLLVCFDMSACLL